MASGGSTHMRQSEMGAEWARVGEGRQPTLKSSLESDQGSSSEPHAGIEPEPRKHISTTRRQSVRPTKQPQGARPLTRSPSKLPTSGAMREPTRIASGSNARLQAMPRSRQSSYNLNGQGFDFGPGAAGTRTSLYQQVGSQSLLPEVNFDDLHNSIAVGEPGMNTAVAAKRGLMSTPSLNSMRTEEKHGVRLRQSMLPSATTDNQSLHRPGLFLRRQSSTKRVEGQAPLQAQSAAQAMPPPAIASMAKPGRRQSHFPTSASTGNIARAPRKSVGPGILTQSASSYAFLQDEPQLGEQRQFTSKRHQSRHETSGAADSTELRNGHLQTRAGKTRSTYSQDGQNPDLLPTPIHAGELTWAMPARSPHRDSQHEGGTPGPARRMSMNPNVAAGGLGARTISPTDVKRMKRLSMMQATLRSSSPMTANDVPPAFPAQYGSSPPTVPIRRRSSTSRRTTPDLSRRSPYGNVPTSANSHHHARLGAASPGRADSFPAAAKSPTFKGRNEAPTDATEELVPPVPAIPKAFESPKNEQDIYFTTASKKSSLAQEVGSQRSISPAEYVSARSSKASYREPTRIVETPNSIRGYTEDIHASIKNGADTAPSRRKREAPRLPPLNLLPLSTPTAEKIAALQNRAAIAGSGAMTPPRKLTKTPTTPMTASKASFPSRYHQKEATAPVPISARANTSHFTNGGEFSSFRAPSSAASSIRGADKEKGRHSPFAASSLPKSTSDFSMLRTKPSADRSASIVSMEAKPSKLAGPRAQPSSSHLRRQSVAQVATDMEANTTSFGSNLRRKLSMSRRRSTSKTDDHPPQPPAHSTMPPPKLPASATTGSLHGSNNTPKPSFLHSRRKSSYSDTLAKQAQTQVPNADTSESGQDPPVRRSLEYRTLDPKSTSSTSGIAPKNTYSNGHSRNPTPAIPIKLDRDDLIAEQEMQKLAQRRKKTEIEARELDALRRRAVAAERVSPTTAGRVFQLNVFERGEIVDYEDVYFAGTPQVEKLVGNLEVENANFGYDDERGDYNIVIGDHLAYRYEVVDVLGKGSFGQVVRCVDHKTGGLVAIKIIRNKKRFHQQALVEVNILQKLKEWDPENTHSMVSFTQNFYFRGHLCISTELLGMNLYEFIKIHDFRGFSIKLIRRFAKQMLNSLVLLKSKKVIHCDLKPENILLAHPAHSEIKVIDFGSSCMENEKVYTYIQSRFYRSPEVILGMNYGMPIDMWSVGCILAELLTGFPLFPGENEQEQLACIMEVFGPPDKHLIEKSTRRKLFFDSLGKPRPVVSSKGKRRRPSSKTLQQALRCDDDAFLDFLTKCLRWDPDRRLKPDEAAQHEFFTGIKAPPPVKTIRGITQPHMVNSSPIKRINSTRLLSHSTEAVASGRPSLAARASARDTTYGSTSPSKPPVKRQSTFNGSIGNVGAKRTTAAQMTQQGSGLPRLGFARTASGKQDMASAAAAIATAVSAGNYRA